MVKKILVFLLLFSFLTVVKASIFDGVIKTGAEKAAEDIIVGGVNSAVNVVGSAITSKGGNNTTRFEAIKNGHNNFVNIDDLISVMDEIEENVTVFDNSTDLFNVIGGKPQNSVIAHNTITYSFVGKNGTERIVGEITLTGDGTVIQKNINKRKTISRKDKK